MIYVLYFKRLTDVKEMEKERKSWNKWKESMNKHWNQFTGYLMKRMRCCDLFIFFIFLKENYCLFLHLISAYMTILFIAWPFKSKSLKHMIWACSSRVLLCKYLSFLVWYGFEKKIELTWTKTRLLLIDFL